MIKLYITLEDGDKKIERVLAARDLEELNRLPISEIVEDMTDTLKIEETKNEADRLINDDKAQS